MQTPLQTTHPGFSNDGALCPWQWFSANHSLWPVYSSHQSRCHSWIPKLFCVEERNLVFFSFGGINYNNQGQINVKKNPTKIPQNVVLSPKYVPVTGSPPPILSICMLRAASCSRQQRSDSALDVLVCSVLQRAINYTPSHLSIYYINISTIFGPHRVRSLWLGGGSIVIAPWGVRGFRVPRRWGGGAPWLFRFIRFEIVHVCAMIMVY